MGGVIFPEQTGTATTTNSRGEVVTDSALLIFKLSERLRLKATLHRCAKAEESGAEEGGRRLAPELAWASLNQLA